MNAEKSTTIIKGVETYQSYQDKIDAINQHRDKFLKQYTFIELLKFSYQIILTNWKQLLIKEVKYYLDLYYRTSVIYTTGSIIDTINQYPDYSHLWSITKQNLLSLFIKYIVIELIYQILFYILNPKDIGILFHTMNKVFHKDIEFFDLYTVNDINNLLYDSEYVSNDCNLIIYFINRYHDIEEILITAYQLYNISYKVLILCTTIALLSESYYKYYEQKIYDYIFKGEKFNGKSLNIDEYIKNIRLLKSFGKEKNC